jgi:hypothetical protein
MLRFLAYVLIANHENNVVARAFLFFARSNLLLEEAASREALAAT